MLPLPFSHSHNSPRHTQGVEGVTMTTGAPSAIHCRAIREDTPNAAPISFHPEAKLAAVRGVNVFCLSIVGLSALCERESLPGRTRLAYPAHMSPPFNPAITTYPFEPYPGFLMIRLPVFPLAQLSAQRTTARVNFSQLFLVHPAPLKIYYIMLK